MIARLAIDFKVDGHRADIIMERASKAHAAFRGSKVVEVEDLTVAAQLSLPHRMRSQPFQSAEFDLGELKQLIARYVSEA